jgi:protein-L-isoaspartate(D-aspartate) O-methyltransferase
MSPHDRFEALRLRMVADQLRARQIQDENVLRAMETVPRHRFVSGSQQHEAYEDRPLPIGHHQTISQPYIVAYMTEALALTGTERVLEVGTGSGYQTAVLGTLAAEVYSLEIVPELCERARATLQDLGYRNVHIAIGDGHEGWLEQAPFDRIIVTAAPAEVPKRLVDQLAASGRMIIPIGAWQQDLVVLTRTPGGIAQARTIPVRFVPMTGKASN